MKKFLYIVLTAGLLAACMPSTPDKPSVGKLPVASELEYTVTKGDQPYRYIFELTNQKMVGVWDFGNNGGVKTGNHIVMDFMFSGAQTAALKAYNKAGLTTEAKEVAFTVEQGSATIPGTPGYYLLGKPWVWDQTVQGHWGNAPVGSTSPSWENAGPNSRPAEMYDDVMQFNGDGSFDLDTKGAIYANEGPAKAGWFGSEYTGATASLVVPYTKPAGETWRWSISSASPYPILTLSGGSKPGAFPSYLPSDQEPSTNNKYEIMLVDENTLWMRAMYSWGGWFFRFKHPAE